MLNLASVRPGGRYIAVDDASGVVVAGILERLGGEFDLSSREKGVSDLGNRSWSTHHHM